MKCVIYLRCYTICILISIPTQLHITTLHYILCHFNFFKSYLPLSSTLTFHIENTQDDDDVNLQEGFGHGVGFVNDQRWSSWSTRHSCRRTSHIGCMH